MLNYKKQVNRTVFLISFDGFYHFEFDASGPGQLQRSTDVETDDDAQCYL